MGWDIEPIGGDAFGDEGLLLRSLSKRWEGPYWGFRVPVWPPVKEGPSVRVVVWGVGNYF